MYSRTNVLEEYQPRHRAPDPDEIPPTPPVFAGWGSTVSHVIADAPTERLRRPGAVEALLNSSHARDAEPEAVPEPPLPPETTLLGRCLHALGVRRRS